MELGRRLDLSLAADRRHLLDALRADGGTVADPAATLDAYLNYFPADWRTVHGGGLVAAGSSAVHISDLFNAASTLQKVSDSHGFDRLVRGFANPTEIASTLFVTAVVGWCVARQVHRGIAFEPEIIARGGRVKRPDFRWFTDLGEPYCECKQAQFVGSRVATRASRLGEYAARSVESAGLGGTERIDLWVKESLRNGWEGRVDQLIAEAIAAYPLRPELCAGEIQGVIRRRADPLPERSGSVTIFQVQVGTTSTLLDVSNAAVSASLSVRNARRKGLQHLLREARSQLPPDEGGVVFIDLRGASSFEHEVRSIIERPTAAPIAWVGLFDLGRPALAAWRDGQPLDARLAE